MAALTDVKNDLFGAVGVEDPQVFKSGVAIKRGVNFKISNVDKTTNYAFLPIPAGFVLTGVYVKENEKCTTGTLTLKTKDGGATLGASVSVGGATLAEKFMTPVAGVTAKDSAGTGTVSVPGGSLAFVNADMACLVSSVKLVDGSVDVVLNGYLMNGGSLTPKALEIPYRTSQSEADYEANKSGGDLYLQKVARA